MKAGGSWPTGATPKAPKSLERSRGLVEHPRLDAFLLVKCCLLLSFLRRLHLLALLLLLLLLLWMLLLVLLFLPSGDLFVRFHHGLLMRSNIHESLHSWIVRMVQRRQANLHPRIHSQVPISSCPRATILVPFSRTSRVRARHPISGLYLHSPAAEGMWMEAFQSTWEGCACALRYRNAFSSIPFDSEPNKERCHEQCRKPSQDQLH